MKPLQLDHHLLPRVILQRIKGLDAEAPGGFHGLPGKGWIAHYQPDQPDRLGKFIAGTGRGDLKVMNTDIRMSLESMSIEEFTQGSTVHVARASKDQFFKHGGYTDLLIRVM